MTSGIEVCDVELLGTPALGLGGEKQLPADLAHCAQAQSAQRRVEVRAEFVALTK